MVCMSLIIFLLDNNDNFELKLQLSNALNILQIATKIQLLLHLTIIKMFSKTFYQPARSKLKYCSCKITTHFCQVKIEMSTQLCPHRRGRYGCSSLQKMSTNLSYTSS